MEFAHAGRHCQACGQQDYLPVPCSVCQGLFCSRHSSHGCVSSSGTALAKVPILQHSPCHICQATNSKVDLQCGMCEKPVCVEHRLAEDHHCSKLLNQNERPISGRGLAAIKEARSRLGQTDSKPDDKQPNSTKKAKSAKAQALVNRMKIKFKAVGNESIPMEHRLYISVDTKQAGRAELLHIYLDKRKTIGDAIEQICRLGQIRNENHLASGRHLSLRPVRDPPASVLSTSIKLGDVDVDIYDGDTFELIAENVMAK